MVHTQRRVLEEDEERRLTGVFDLEDTVAREVLVPRYGVVALQAD